MTSLISRSEIESHRGKIPEIDTEIFQRTNEFIYRDGFKKSSEYLDSLTTGYRTIYSTIGAEGEIYNGGFAQYFSNSTAEDLHFHAIEGFKRIGALKTAQLFENTFSSLLEASPTFRTSHMVYGIQDAFERAGDEISDEPLASADIEFYRLVENTENLNDLRVKYVYSNLDDF
jgi:hypothetical protein